MRARLQVLLVSVLALLAWAGSARALSIAPGSETLFTQLERSDTALLARFAGAEPGFVTFVVDQVLQGRAGSEARVKLSEGQTTLSGLEPGRRYLLLLADLPDGSFALPLDSLSILSVPERDLPETLAAVRAWDREGQDPAAKRATLMRFATARSLFLQDSAVMGLTHLRLMNRDALRDLMEPMVSGRIAHPRARETLVRFAGVMGATEHRERLMDRVRDVGETQALREAALFALHAMDPEAARELEPTLAANAGLNALMRSLER